MNLRKSIICILLSIVFLIVISPKSSAASLVISFSSSSAKVGDIVTVTVTGKGATGKVDLSVSGNAKLDSSSIFVDGSASTNLTINGEGNVKVTATASDMADNSNAQRFEGSTAGTIKVASNSSTSSNNQNNNASDNNKNTSKSNNANLSNLGIKPNDFKGFKASTTSYDVTVPNDTEKVTVYATAQDKKATIKGTGTQKLKVGKNALNVVVTAEDGTTTKTYTINVTREEAKNDTNETSSNTTETTTNDTSDKNEETSSEGNTENSDLKNLTIKGFNLTPAFSPDIYEYKVDVTGDVSSLDIETEGTNHNVSIDIVGNENLTDGENTITLLVYNEETKQNSTYQIIVNKTSADVAGMNNDLDMAVKKANKIRYILIGIVACIIIGIVIFIVVKHKLNNDEDEKYEYDEDDRDRLNLDDEDEFFNRVSNKNKNISFDINESSNSEEDNMDSYKNSETEKTVYIEEKDIEEKNKILNQVSSYDTEDYFAKNKTKKKGKHF